MLTRAFLPTVAALGASLGACAANVQHAVPIAVLVDGDRAAVGPLPATVDGLALRELTIPAAPPALADDSAAAIIRARTAYVSGQLDACRGELAQVDVTALLARGDRASAARALAFDAACAWANATKGDARADAEMFASYGLELPDAAVAPDVEALIGDAIAAAGSAAHATVPVSGPVGATLLVDGRPAACTLPCTLDLAAGYHVIAASADGFAPAHERVHVPDVTRVDIAQTVATPALAAQQWRARQGRGLPEADATGASLMARFGGERRIAWLHGDARLSGGLVVDGVVVSRSDAARGDPATLVRELAYDGGVLVRPAVWQRPWFWIAVSAAVIAVAGVVVAVTYTPTTNTAGGF